jgi:SPP1 family predicted phage head-tail adaptor
MRAGQLRHIMIIQSATETQDTYGGIIETWNTVATVWAGIFQLSGREFFAAKQVNSEINCKLKLRYRGEMCTKMRGIINGTRRYFDFQASIDVGDRGRELEILAIEREFTTPHVFSTDFSKDFS